MNWHRIEGNWQQFAGKAEECWDKRGGVGAAQIFRAHGKPLIAKSQKLGYEGRINLLIGQQQYQSHFK